jgi:hypothetical protein
LRSSIAEQGVNFVLPLFRQGSAEYQPAVNPFVFAELEPVTTEAG